MGEGQGAGGNPKAGPLRKKGRVFSQDLPRLAGSPSARPQLLQGRSERCLRPATRSRAPRASSISPAHVLTAPGHASPDRSSGGGRPRPLPSPAVSAVAAGPGKSPGPFPHAGAPAPAPPGALEIAPPWAAQVFATSTRSFLIVSFVTSRDGRRETSPRSSAPSGSSPLQEGQRLLCSATRPNPCHHLPTHALPGFLPLAWEDELFKLHPVTQKGEGCPGLAPPWPKPACCRVPLGAPHPW